MYLILFCTEIQSLNLYSNNSIPKDEVSDPHLKHKIYVIESETMKAKNYSKLFLLMKKVVVKHLERTISPLSKLIEL